MSDHLVFRSKIDMWLLIVLMLVVAICLVSAAQYWNAISTRQWYLGLPLAVGVVLPLWFLFSLRYFLSETELKVHCGPFRWTIGIDEITNIAATRDVWSSPAMSLDRIRIDYAEGRSLMISPEPRQAFLAQLEARIERLKH